MPFRTIRSIEIPEIKATLTELVHEKSQARVMHLGTEDDENFFDLSFQTYPKTSNGVAHILEHTVLCGSKKFPVRDPFFSMNRRSLNTFMNAFTGADFTCYPASTQVPKDFYNLLDVYLDAVFHPTLSRLSFLQEGHRFEFEDEKLTLKGIVYNEMKGAMASPDSRLNEALMAELFPALTYGINSGGDPKEIPNLTYDELLAFHKEFYHPSRCLFFFYGNLPLQGHLDFIEKKVLDHVTPLPPLPPLPPQPRFKAKKQLQMSYPIAKGGSKGEEKTFISFGWLTTSILNQEELLALNVIDLVLMGTDAAPLKIALLKSHLCKQADSSLEDEISEVPFVLVCKGCAPDAADKLEKVIFETLATIASKPLAEELVEGAIHQLEQSRKEISVPYGLALYFRSALLKQHGGNPEDGLKIHTLFKQLREKVKDPLYLPGLIKKHFLQNQHFVRVVMHPDEEMQKKESAEEEKRIRKAEKNLSEKEKALIVEQATLLEKLQEREESLDVLPKLGLDDVSKTGKEFSLKREALGDLSLLYHPCFTNEILYADLIFDLPEIKEDDLPFLRLFALFLPQVGSGGRNYKENLGALFEHTGGIGVDLDLGCLAKDPHTMIPALSLRGKALYRKSDKFFALLKDILLTADFKDVARIKELLIQHNQELEQSIETSPLRYALQLSTSGLSTPLKVRNNIFGIEYYKQLSKIVKDFEKNPQFLIEKLEEMKNLCLALKGGELVIGADEKMIDTLKKEKFFGLTEADFKASTKWRADITKSSVSSQGRITASPVVFTACSIPSLSYVDPSTPALSIASKIMENKILHKRIREQGGAYGAGASNAPMSGYFYFYSYRDPHLASTRKAFEEAALMLAKGQFDAEDLEEAKFGILQDVDAPLAPAQRAYTAYERLRSGRTPEIRQEYRKRLLQCGKKEIVGVAEKVLIPGLKQGVTVSFGAEEVLKEGAFPIFKVKE